MRKILTRICAAAVLLSALYSCKTTEENYRAAYEKTIAARDSVAAVENTIYGAERRRMQSATVATDSGAVEVNRLRVKVTGAANEGGGGDGGAAGATVQLRRFNVVAAQFKQRFNAMSMCGRLAAAGYPDAFVVETAEPYYYVVVASYADAADAARRLDAVRTAADIAMRPPCPFILEAVGRR